jgi:hypothetical protein
LRDELADRRDAIGDAARFRLLPTPQICYIPLTSTVREAPDVDLALKLNVLVVCAVITFVGAILLGAF